MGTGLASVTAEETEAGVTGTATSIETLKSEALVDAFAAVRPLTTVIMLTVGIVATIALIVAIAKAGVIAAGVVVSEVADDYITTSTMGSISEYINPIDESV